MKALTCIFILLSGCLFCPDLQGQTGAWTPPGADLSYPRTLLKASEISVVRNAISTDPELNQVYGMIYARATQPWPAGVGSTGERQFWSYISKNAAFFYPIDREWNNGVVSPLTQAGRDSLLLRAKKGVTFFNPAIDPLSSYEEWIWRTRDLLNMLTCYDLLRGAGVPPDSLLTGRRKLQNMAGDLFAQATLDVFGYSFFNFAKNNHGLCTAAALGFAAVVLSDADSSDLNYKASSWINLGMYQIDNILWRDASRQSDPVLMTGYAEGPHYFKVAFQNCLPFFKAMKHFVPDGNYSFTYKTSTRSIRHPWFDPAFDLLYDWMGRIHMPDGRSPQIDDSFLSTYPTELAILGRPEYNWKKIFSMVDPSQGADINQYIALTNDMRADYVAAMTPHGESPWPLFQALPQAGNLIFRSSWDTSAIYFLLLAENGRALQQGGGHNQADELSFSLEAYGQLLALDPGYISWTDRNLVNGAQHHNMILVNGAGPLPGGNGANGAQAFIENFFDTQMADYGEARTSYLGVDLSRKSLFIRNRYVWIADFVRSANTNNYTWQLNGYGRHNGAQFEGNFVLDSLNQQGTWTNNGVSLFSRTVARDGISGIDTLTQPHDINGGWIRYHNTLRVNKNNVPDSEFLTILYPYLNDTPQVATLGQGSAPALKFSDSGYTDVIFAREPGTQHTLTALSSGLAGDLTSDAGICFFSLDSTNAFSQFFIDEGNTLSYNNISWLSASTVMDVAFQVMDDTSAQGYASLPGTLVLHYDQIPLSVWGTQVLNWSYNQGTSELTLDLGGAGKFFVFTTLVAGLESGSPVYPIRLFPNPARESISLEFESPGLEIVSLEIRNSLGQPVSRQKIEISQAGTQKISIQTGNWPSGQYFACLSTDDGRRAIASFRLIK